MLTTSEIVSPSVIASSSSSGGNQSIILSVPRERVLAVFKTPCEKAFVLSLILASPNVKIKLLPSSEIVEFSYVKVEPSEMLKIFLSLAVKPFAFEIKLTLSPGFNEEPPEICALTVAVERSVLPSVKVSKVSPFDTRAGILKLIVSKS